MASFNEFTRLVSNFTPNVPPFVVERAGQQCAQDFFSRTVEYQSEIDLMTIVGQDFYTLKPPVSDTYINEVLSVVDDNKCHVAYEQRHNTLELMSVPRDIKDLTITVSLAPTLEASEIPDDLYFRHATALRFGVLAILKAQNGTEWFNASESTYYQQRYEQEINQAKVLDYTKNLSLTMQIPEF